MRRKSDSVRARSMSVYIYRKRRLSHAKYVHVHSLRSSASTGHLVIVLATRESPEGPDRIVPCPGSVVVGLDAAPGARPSGERVSGLQHSGGSGAARARPGTCASRH